MPKQFPHFLYLMALLKLIRAAMGGVIVLAFIAGKIVAGSAIGWENVFIISIILLALTSGGFALNDYLDREKDRINRPDRPIPSGKVSKEHALWIAISFLSIALLLSILVSIPVLVFTVVVLILLAIYSTILKRIFLVGNLTTALLTSSPFILNVFLGGSFVILFFPIVLTFILIFGREIIKDIVDLQGDRHERIPTLPVLLGIKKSSEIATAVFCLFLVLNFVPFFIGLYNFYYFIIVNLLLNSMLVLLLVPMFRELSKQSFLKFLQFSHLILLLGIIGIVLGSF